MFRVIAKITIDGANADKNRKTPPRDAQGALRKTPPRSAQLRKTSTRETIQISKDGETSRIDQNQEGFITNKKSKKKKLLGGVSKRIFINLIMLIAITLYAVFGALTFQILEQHEELRLCEEGMGKHNKELRSLADRIMRYIQFNLTENLHDKLMFSEMVPVQNMNQVGNNRSITETIFEEISSSYIHRESLFRQHVINENHVNIYLHEFRDHIFKIEDSNGFSGRNCKKNSKWKFTSALLFVITIMSSIGYGHISPATWEGQIVCICYSLIGIPFYLMTIAKLSTNFGDLFTFLYVEFNKINPITKWLAWRRERLKIERKRLKQSKSTTSMMLKTSLSHHEGLSITTSELDHALYVLDELDYQGDVNSDDSDDEQDERHDDEVPISLSILLIIAFLYSGNYFFHKTEDWSMTTSFYYNFITLTSIGFGDLVPGKEQDNLIEADIRLMLCSIYCFLGLAVLGTCIVMILDGIKREVARLIKNLKKCWSSFTCRKPTHEDKKKEEREMLERVKQLRYYFDDENEQCLSESSMRPKSPKIERPKSPNVER